ncbi:MULTISPECIES: ABC transporter permease [Micromonospora]|uniref:Transport permease protein n=2 Tax=Micromonospora TaxID=1873 RepID=A0A1C6SN65_9ACTN|nr:MULTISPECIES: ABC transporter permease [Micromonospora]TWJ30360.1 teichoic acid transport system permease protein [Micromonospora sagamiensis]BCL16610.1 transport permease protein [Micromonospora sagamiensis]SCL30888.1 teichoic acid transport system permease protein [Micromonospora inyonensis]
MANTAVADADSGLTRAQLAARYGLTVAGERPTLAGYTRQLWSYRHFIAAYANAKLIATFATARLGRVWQVLTPLTNAAIYFLIFGVILNTRAGVDNFIAYLCVGLFVFNFTQSVVLNGTQSISGNLGLIRALHFPRASLPIAVTLTQFQNLLTAMLVLVAIVLVTGEPLTLEWLLVLPALLLQSVFNVGTALGMARLGSKMTDLKQLMPFVMRTWMYASGVLYSVQNFAKHLPGWAQLLVELNPLLIYIELVRHALMEDVPLTSSAAQLWLVGTAWALVAFVGGYVYFWRGEKEYGRG